MAVPRKVHAKSNDFGVAADVDAELRDKAVGIGDRLGTAECTPLWHVLSSTISMSV